MARTRMADWLGRTGNRILRFLSNWEEGGKFKKTARWLKLGVLGVFVTLIAACGPKKPGPMVTCYEPVATFPQITELQVKPNPTNGSDKIKVTSLATIINADIEVGAISDAVCFLGKDTVKMTRLVGGLNDTLEIFTGELTIEGMKPGTTWVGVKVTSNQGIADEDRVELYITEE